MAKKHELTVSEAARLGGLKVSKDRLHMAEIGRRGALRTNAIIAERRKKAASG